MRTNDEKGNAGANKFPAGGHFQSASGDPEPIGCNALGWLVTLGEQPGRPSTYPMPWELHLMHRGKSEAAKNESEGNTAVAKSTNQSGSNGAEVVFSISADDPRQQHKEVSACLNGAFRC